MIPEVQLPEGWTLADSLVDTTHVGELAIHIAGLIAAKGESSVAGSAASTDSEPLARAQFELIERCAIFEAKSSMGAVPTLDHSGEVLGEVPAATVFPAAPSDLQRFSVSNGVALGPDFEFARTRAIAELVERDLVLRSWYGWQSLQPAQGPSNSVVEALAPYYEFSFRTVIQEPFCLGIALGIPKRSDAPLLLAHAVKATLTEAVEAALDEAVQRLGFLWGEEIPQSEPEFSASPEFHQEYYLWPERHQVLLDWFEGKHSRQPVPWPDAAQPYAEPELVNLMPLDSERWVIRAMGGGRLPLIFGEAAFDVPEHMRIHPVS